MELTAWTSAANDVANIFALLLAGIWTYRLFWKRRQTKPRAELEQFLSAHRLPDGKLLLHIELRIKNIGEVLLNISTLRTRVLQVLPLTNDLAAGLGKGLELCLAGEQEIRWGLVREWNCPDPGRTLSCQIEPGETDEFHFDAVIPGDIERIQVHSFARNIDVKGQTIGWRRTTHCEA